jgi:hypothetical protein
VAGREGGQRDKRFGPPDLTDDDSIGPHPQRGPEQLSQIDCARAFDVGRPGDQRHRMACRQPQLGRLLDHHDAFVGRHLHEERVHQRRLPRAGRTGYHEVLARADQSDERGMSRRADHLGCGEVVEVHYPSGETPDRDERSARRDGRKNDVHP